MSKIVVSVIGAGGKMGTRTSNNLTKKPEEFELLLVEARTAGIKSIKEGDLSLFLWRRPWQRLMWWYLLCRIL